MTATTTEIQDLIATAQQLKDEGNVLFQSREYIKAVCKYTKIPFYVKHLDAPVEMTNLMKGVNKPDRPSKTQLAQIKNPQSAAYLNSATCFLRLAQFQRGLEFVDKALQVNKNNLKAILRRGQFLLRLGLLDEANRDLFTCLAKNPNSQEIKSEFAQLQVAMKQYQRELDTDLRRMYGGMFGWTQQEKQQRASLKNITSSSSSYSSPSALTDLVSSFL